MEYVEKGIEVSFEMRWAKKFLPLIHDPRGYASHPKPEGVYYRILRRKSEEAIQYFVRWDEQDCIAAYPLVGHLFSHKFDYEPIIAFIKDGEIGKLVISATGGLTQGGHQTEIYREDESSVLGKVTYRTSKAPEYPFGEHESVGYFREEPLDKVTFRAKRPMLGVATCYHVYTAMRSYLRGPILDMKLFALKSEVLDRWYCVENFGHDVSNPWKYPHIRYHPSPKMEILIEERSRIAARNTTIST